MKGMNYSSLTSTLRRIHQATSRSKLTGIPARELLDQDRELRYQHQSMRVEDSQRRSFLKTLGGMGIGAGLAAMGDSAIASVVTNSGNQYGKNKPNVAIVGAGAGGLRTAHRLAQYGIASRVFEANNRIGGRMYSNRGFFSDNRVVEWGGELISTEHTALRNLAHQLNLKLEDANKLSVGDEETYFIGGHLYSEDNLLDEWVDGLYEPFKQALKDAPWQPLYNIVNTDAQIAFDRMTAREMLEGIGYPSSHWVHELLMTDLVAEYGILEENSAINLIYLLGWTTRNAGGLPLAGTDERLHVVGGNDLVMHGMANELPDDTIETGRTLTAIVGNSDGPYTLIFDTGPDENCEKLVLAIPYGLIRNLEIDSRITDAFSFAKNESISKCVQADNGKIILEFSDRHWDRIHEIDGREINQAARAYSDSDKFISTWEGNPGNPSPRGILVNYTGGIDGQNLGGEHDFGVASATDVAHVLPQFEQIWPGISEKYTGKALVADWWNSPFSKGAFVSPTVDTMTTWWGAQWETEGNIFFAGESCDEEHWSYMNGAILSGERVAKEIAQG